MSDVVVFSTVGAYYVQFKLFIRYLGVVWCICSGCYGDIWSEVMEAMAHFLSSRYFEVKVYHLVCILIVVMVTVCSPSIMLTN